MATPTQRTVTIGIAAAVLAVAALGLWMQRPRPASDAPVLAVSAPDNGGTVPMSDTDASAATPPAPERSPSATADPSDNEPAVAADEGTAEDTRAADADAPAFDEVRQDADGMTVIAGRAVPGSSVTLLQDGNQVAEATADSSGKFAAIAMLPPDGQGHVLSLLQETEGTQTVSVDQVILAPAQPSVAAEPAQQQTAPEKIAEATKAPPSETATGVPSEENPALVTTEGNSTGSDVAQSTADTDGRAGPTAEAVAAPRPEHTAERPSETDQAAVPGPDVASTTAPDVTETASASAQNRIDAASSEPAQIAATATSTPPGPAAADVAQPADLPEAPQQVAVLKSTAEGVELLQPAAPRAMTNVSLDTISYSEVGEVRLAGRAQSDAVQVRVYLDNDAVISLPVDEQGRWRGDVPDVDEGVYTLRIDEVNSAGDVTSRVETPFKRESEETLAAASALADGPISAITVQKGATLWAIARDRYGDGLLYVRVFEANKGDIRDPDLIYPGQVFDLPD